MEEEGDDKGITRRGMVREEGSSVSKNVGASLMLAFPFPIFELSAEKEEAEAALAAAGAEKEV